MIVSKSELAQELGIAASGITKMISRGMPVRADGRVDMLTACRWVCDNAGEGIAVGNAREWVWLLDKPHQRADAQ